MTIIEHLNGLEQGERRWIKRPTAEGFINELQIEKKLIGPVVHGTFEAVSETELSETTRGGDGFGSTLRLHQREELA